MNDDAYLEAEDLIARIHHDDMTETLFTDISAAIGRVNKLQTPQPNAPPEPAGDWTANHINKEKRDIEATVDQSITVFRTAYELKEYENVEFWAAINDVKNAYTRFKEAPTAVRKDFQEKIVEQIVQSDILPTLSLILEEQLKAGFVHFKDGRKFGGQLCRVAYSTLAFFFYFADTSPIFSRVVTQESCSLLNCIKMLLDKFMVSYFLQKLADVKELQEMLFIGLALSYNLVMHDDSETIRRIQEVGLMDSVRPYLYSAEERFKVLPLLFMVYVAKESDAKHYCSNPLVIKYLLDQLDTATKSEDKSACGYSAPELMRALEKLAALDVNKELLAEIGTISVMKDLLVRGTVSEIKSSLHILMQLAFNKELAKDIHHEVHQLVERQLYDHEDPGLQKAARGLMWVMLEYTDDGDGGAYTQMHGHGGRSLRRLPSRQPNDVRGSGIEPAAIDSGQIDFRPGVPPEHIMISYSWDNQEKVRKIREYLEKNGFKVWFDEERMGPNLLDSMAEAVEEAWVVITCISRKYQLSRNTRLEAEYASKLQKRIIPVKMEPYEPDGWLGLLVGRMFVHDFTADMVDNSAYYGLFTSLTRIRNRASLESGDSTVVPTITETVSQNDTVTRQTTAPLTLEPSLSYLDHWDENVVNEWFKNNKINSTPLGSVSGRELRLLVKMRKESPDAFYRYLMKQIKLRDMAALIEALDRL